MICPKCNAQVDDNALFCGECGCKLEKPSEPVQQSAPQYSAPPQSAPQYSAPQQSIPQHSSNKQGNTILTAVIIAAVCVIAVLIGIILKITVFDTNKNDTVAVNTTQQSQTQSSAAPASAEPQNNGISLDVSNSGQEPQTAQVQAYLPPVFPIVEVSSTRGYDVSERTGETVYYYKEYLTDGIMTNCWTPNRHTDSSPYILLKAPNMQTVHGVQFADGYFKSQETYTRNRRISRVEIVYNGGSMIYDVTEHVFGQMQNVVFAQPVQTDFIMIKILSTIYGDWLDTCVSEVAVY